jgi:alkylphosphonate utilization operon protein PhnA
MPLSPFPKLRGFFSNVVSDIEIDADEEATRRYSDQLDDPSRMELRAELGALIAAGNPPLTELGTEANRWFGTEQEALEWLQNLMRILDRDGAPEGALTALDSNGAPLKDEDSVTVIKDLKVKGGSSDLKRGTLIRKIKLTSDPKLIECKVDGSVLVLKTEFLKKA